MGAFESSIGDRVLPRRVLMTADTLGGVWTYALDLCRGLSARGIDVALATMGGPPGRDQRREAQGIRGLELFESRFALEWMDDPWRDVERAGEWLQSLERRTAPDVVHLNGYSHAILDWSAPVLVVAHSCVTSWWRAVYGEPAPERYDRYRRRVLSGLSAADVVVAPSLSMLRMLENEHGPLRRALVIPNGASAESFRPLPKQRFFLACARLWDRGKNVSVLLDVASRLPWPVRIAGDPTPPGGLPRSVDASVEFLGKLPRDAVREQMGRAAVFVHPARYEPFGLSPLEAALSGAALVLGDVESLRELWADTALFVAPDDHDALVAALRRLAEDPSFRDRLSARSRMRALRFSLDRMTESYLSAYAGLDRRRRSAPPESGPSARVESAVTASAGPSTEKHA
jgi:glycosyltransferase involved in cell wall biosynthesis